MQNFEGTNLVVRHFWDDRLWGIIGHTSPHLLFVNGEAFNVLRVNLKDIDADALEQADDKFMQWKAPDYNRDMHGEIIEYLNGAHKTWLEEICGEQANESPYVINSALVDDGTCLRIVTYDWFKDLGLVFELTKLEV